MRASDDTTASVGSDAAFEKHFTAKELAKQWHLGERTVLDLCLKEPDVLKIGQRSNRRRTRVSIRIPLSVAKRIYAKLQEAK